MADGYTWPGAARRATCTLSTRKGSMADLVISNLHAAIDGNEILRGVDLELSQGQVHAIMGPNGSGKSTLAHVLMGHPAYEVTAGEVTFKGTDVLELEPDERPGSASSWRSSTPRRSPA